MFAPGVCCVLSFLEKNKLQSPKMPFFQCVQTFAYDCICIFASQQSTKCDTSLFTSYSWITIFFWIYFLTYWGKKQRLNTSYNKSIQTPVQLVLCYHYWYVHSMEIIHNLNNLHRKALQIEWDLLKQVTIPNAKHQWETYRAPSALDFSV